MAKPGPLGAQMQRNSAATALQFDCNTDILNYQGVGLQRLIKGQGFVEQLPFVLENNGVEGDIHLFSESLSNATRPAQAFLVEIGGKSTGAESFSGKINRIGTGQAGCFQTGWAAGRRKKFDRSGWRLCHYSLSMNQVRARR